MTSDITSILPSNFVVSGVCMRNVKWNYLINFVLSSCSDLSKNDVVFIFYDSPDCGRNLIDDYGPIESLALKRKVIVAEPRLLSGRNCSILL